MPAFAQDSSMGWPPGAPLKPTEPIASSPLIIGTPPPSGMTSVRLRWPVTSPSAVRFAQSAEVRRNVSAVYALRRASSRLCGDAPSPWRNTRSRPARSRTAIDTRGVHWFRAVSAMTKAILIEMFFSESTCASTDEDAATSAAKIVTRPNRTDIESSLSTARCPSTANCGRGAWRIMSHPGPFDNGPPATDSSPGGTRVDGSSRVAEICYISAGTLIETRIMAIGLNVLDELDELITEFGIRIAPVDASQARIAAQGFAKYGKGRHAA